MFDVSSIPISVGRRKDLADRINFPLIDIAQDITLRNKRYYFKDNNNPLPLPDYDRYTLVDIQNNKVICDEALFFCGAVAVAENSWDKANIEGLLEMSKNLALYATYFKQKNS